MRDSAGVLPANVKHYSPILKLGAGGMGKVRLAVAQGGFNINKLVVLKTLRRELLGNQTLRRMLLEEACLSARLAHPNVVQVHKVVSGDNPTIVMEYLDGQPLSAILNRAGEQFSTAMQLRILSHVLAGLHYSHELRDYDGTPLNIVHRDVSPQNVFVTYEGLVKVLDFGLAKVAIGRSRTKSGAIKGKIEYMPVEQLMGGKVDRRVDIHAVGCMLWQACTGQRLWANESEAAVVRHMMTGNIPLPSTRRPVHPRLEAIVMKAMEFDPKDRYQTALALQEEIDEFLLQTPDAPSTHDIAAFVSTLFGEQRKALSEVISAAMNKPNAPALQSERTERKADTGPWFTVRTFARTHALRAVGILSALLVLGGAGVWQVLSGNRDADTKANTAAQSHRFVTLRVSALPRDAALTIDSWPTHENPVTLRLPQDKAQHEIRAVLSGYETTSRLVQLENDLSLDLTLERTTPGSESPGLATPGASPLVQTGTSDPAQHQRKKPRATHEPDSSCNPPFYFQNGVKHFKQQCL